MRVTVLRGVFISSFGTFCVNVAGGPAGGWLLILYAATNLNNLAKETRTVKCAFLSPVPHQCPVDTRVQFR